MCFNVRCGAKLVLALFLAILECLLFGLTLNGWPNLVYLIKQDGIYNYLCESDNSSVYESNFQGNLSSEQVPGRQEVCKEEEAVYNLAYTIGQTLRYTAYLPVAFVIDRIGLKTARLLACFFAITGGLMLGLCTVERPYLLIPGCAFVGFSGPSFILANLQIANAFPSTKATVLSILGAAQAGAAGLYVSFKFLSDYASVSWNTSFLIWAGCSSLTLVTTFLVLPMMLKSMKENANENFENIPESQADVDRQTSNKVESDTERDQIKNYNTITQSKDTSKKKGSFMASLLSFSFIIHCYSITVYNLNVGFYTASFNWWINEVTDNLDTVSALTDMFGLVTLIKVVIAPLGGMLMDYHVNKYKKVFSLYCCQTAGETVWFFPLFGGIFVPLCAHLYVLNILYTANSDVRRAGFFPLLLNAVLATSLLISTTVNNSVLAVGISILLFPLVQGIFVVSTFSYTRISFPREHFNRLIGIIHFSAILETLSQHGLFRLLMQNQILARMIVLGLLGISFLNPFHLLCLRKKSQR